MKRSILLSLCFLLLTAFPARAALRVVEAVVTTGVSDHGPVDSVQTYPAAVKRLYCFTHLLGAEGETFISHIWIRGNTEVARMKLPVRARDWRTWSAKSFLPTWKGKWRVEIRDSQEKLLSTVHFTLN